MFLIITPALNFTFELGFLNGILIAGSTQATRFTAARQLGEIAKSHPQDLASLLKKVILFWGFISSISTTIIIYSGLHASFLCWINLLTVSLYEQVSHYLRSKNWDTRVAAAHAIGAIVQTVKHTSVSELIDCVGLKISEAGLSGTIQDVLAMPDFQSAFKRSVFVFRVSTSCKCTMRVVYWLMLHFLYNSFDISNVLDFGALLASGGQVIHLF